MVKFVNQPLHEGFAVDTFTSFGLCQALVDSVSQLLELAGTVVGMGHGNVCLNEEN